MRAIIRHRSSRRAGVALVIVLAFVVLISGLIIAFFSRSINDRDLSNSSADQQRVMLFAQGTVAQVVGDLKQEIAAGSLYPAPTPGAAGSISYTIYQPATPRSAVLCPSGQVNGGLPANVVKRSARNVPFYDAGLTDASTGGSVYPATDIYPASRRAYPIASTAPALNGRTVTLDRWNKPLLIPTTSDTVPTPVTGNYAAPDWVLVARDGGNPTVWNANMTWTSLSTFNFSNDPTIIGRYAYTIYDEGGLLDMNAAGYPVNADFTPAMLASPYEVGRKSTLAMADLKQLHSTGKSGLTAAEIGGVSGGGFLGWRNAGTMSAASTANPYGVLQLFNPGSFLTVNTSTTDRAFLSRQQLLDFVATKLNGSASARDALQYMGTFSRDLNQPSLAPVHTTLPPLLASGNGGNDQPPASSALTYDNLNPWFLGIGANGYPVLTTRDGAIIPQKDALIKRRFALNRLAWLTYKGPSASRNATDPDVMALINTYGFTADFLNQGTDANIQYYFGLKWNTAGYWSCNHLYNGAIQTLSQVRVPTSGSSREADFLELLKAAITTGALGKSANNTSAQDMRDKSVDTQVLQIAANLIDQFDVDGYPTHIRNTGNLEVRGVENLPYLYRVRNVAWRTADPAPIPSDRDTAKQPGSTTFTNAGSAVLMQIPEIWNPHAYAGTNDASLGSPHPSSLSVSVYSGLPAPNFLNLAAVTSANVNVRSWVYKGANGIADGRENSTAFTAHALGASTGAFANPALTFTHAVDAFREPTMLVKAGLNGLTAPNLQAQLAADGIIATASGVTVQGSPTVSGTGATSGPFVGVYLGKGPMMWTVGTGGTAHTDLAAGLRVDTSSTATTTTPPTLTYQIACDNPNSPGNLIAYDEKYFAVEGYSSPVEGTLLGNTQSNGALDYQGQMLGGTRFMTGFDPRTSRFGMQTSGLGEDVGTTPSYYFPPGPPGRVAWIDLAKYQSATTRPDENAGFGAATSSVAPPANGQGWKWDGLLHYGLFAQNSLAGVNNQQRFDGDAPSGTATAQFYADADGVVRRGSAAYAMTTNGSPSATGLPTVTAYGTATGTRQPESRPLILNRPFRNVGELGYAFSDTPWKNVDFMTPESGYAGLLDVFCINGGDNPEGLVAGKVNLNTRQVPVLQAILAGAYRDEFGGVNVSPLNGGETGEAQAVAALLVQRTQPGGTTRNNTPSAPLVNPSDLVGRWKSTNSGLTMPIDGSTAYDGFSADLLSTTNAYVNNIPRYREAAIRALSDVGTTRTWNLLIDVVAQTGRYPPNATSAEKFIVDGEQRCWLHVAIDRLTGKVIGQQLEIVRE